MAGSGAPVRQLRRGPAPIASFDHDVSDESSPETKQSFRLPEIREDPGRSASAGLAPPEQRARSHSTPGPGAALPAGGLTAAPAPRIDISRASSSSHHDSRDSSPELALFAGAGEDSRTRLELGFREDGALELRSSTEELAFLEGAPGEPRPAAPPQPASRRHSRKDSQGSEAALLAVSGRTSRLSSVGSQCSAHSALSAFSHQSRQSVGRLSVVSGISRSPSPHRMLLETSFCGPKPIETDPEICAAAVEERLLEIAKLSAASPAGAAPVDARDRREVRTEATVERAAARAPPPSPAPAPLPPAPLLPADFHEPPLPKGAPAPAPVLSPAKAQAPVPAPAPAPVLAPPLPAPEPASAPILTPVLTALDDDKLQKETQNRARVQERRARPRVRREPSEPEVYKSVNRSKDIIRIKLKPDDDYEEEEDESKQTSEVEAEAARGAEAARKPASLELWPARPTELPAPASPGGRRAPRDSRTPSPAGVPVSRKSSFCSLFKSRETIASPDSPSDALRRKRSLTEGRSRSKSRDRSATPTSAGKIRGSVLSLFRTPRKSAASPSPSSREGSPVVQPQRQITAITPQPVERTRRGDKLKYYEDTKDGIIHIPLRTPPDERPGSSSVRRPPDVTKATVEVTTHREPTQTRPASAPQSRPVSEREFAPPAPSQKPIHRTVLPDGSIIIPLRSPTERMPEDRLPSPPVKGSSPPEDTPPIVVETKSIAAVEVKTVQAAVTPREKEDIVKIPPVDVQRVESASATDDGRRRRKERLVFTTHVGSREQVFSTQFSITKTPSVTSEISGSFPSFVDGDDMKTSSRDVAPGAIPASPGELSDGTATSPGNRSAGTATSPGERPGNSNGSAGARPGGTAFSPGSPQEPVRDSSESEPSSESAPPLAGDEVEKRGLVVQQSFEEELPYVPTTLPQERSVALPMVPVRERGGVLVSGVSRPRASAPPAAPRAPPAAPRAPRPAPATPPAALPAAPPDKLRIHLPRRPSTAAPPARRPDRPRTRSGSDSFDSRPKTEWIDFEEVPERRKQPKRIQTLPAAAASGAASAEAGGAGGAVVFSYVEPEQCRCECHAHARDDDQLPLLQDELQPLRVSSPSPEGAEEARVALRVQVAPFTADLDLRPDGVRRGRAALNPH
nr:serine/arginine repetitive matrix protein 1 isoform X2 [Helicoverpa armigera]